MDSFADSYPSDVNFNMNPIVIYTSIDNKENAKSLAKRIINNKLAACVNIIPIEESLYYWQGKLESESEFQLMIKTDIRYKSSIEKLIKKNHSYELPEILVINIDDGSNEYLKWMEDNLK